MLDNPHITQEQMNAIQDRLGANNSALWRKLTEGDWAPPKHQKAYNLIGTPQAADKLAECLLVEAPTARRGYIVYLFEALDALLPEDEFWALVRDAQQEMMDLMERSREDA